MDTVDEKPGVEELEICLEDASEELVDLDAEQHSQSVHDEVSVWFRHRGEKFVVACADLRMKRKRKLFFRDPVRVVVDEDLPKHMLHD